jgi:hypothetical protein
MLFYAFCEFANGSSRYLQIKASTREEAYRRVKHKYHALQVLWIISSLDPICQLLGLESPSLSDSMGGGEKAA